jgi:hypothetical protein
MKIAILGSAPSSRKLAPFNDPSWEIWACSPMNYDLPRIDAWFELHNLDRKFVKGNEPYMNALVAHPRVYIAYPDPRLPDGIVFDPKPLVKRFGPYFMTSQPAWMMAFALMQNPTHIGMWGIDMSASGEYAFERPGCHYYLQKADEAGVEIVLPPQCDIAEPVPTYAYKEFWPMYWKMKESRKELDQRIADNMRIIQDREREKYVLQGARDYWEYVNNTWLKGPTPWSTPGEVILHPPRMPDAKPE